MLQAAIIGSGGILQTVERLLDDGATIQPHVLPVRKPTPPPDRWNDVRTRSGWLLAGRPAPALPGAPWAADSKSHA
jgi:hypothetical protein